MDLSNKSPDCGSCLFKTVGYLTSNELGVLKDEDIHLVYHLV